MEVGWSCLFLGGEDCSRLLLAALSLWFSCICIKHSYFRLPFLRGSLVFPAYHSPAEGAEIFPINLNLSFNPITMNFQMRKFTMGCPSHPQSSWSCWVSPSLNPNPDFCGEPELADKSLRGNHWILINGQIKLTSSGFPWVSLPYQGLEEGRLKIHFHIHFAFQWETKRWVPWIWRCVGVKYLSGPRCWPPLTADNGILFIW